MVVSDCVEERSVRDDVYGVAEALGYVINVETDGRLMEVNLFKGDLELYAATLKSYGHDVTYSMASYVCYVRV